MAVVTGLPYSLACREYRDEPPAPLQCENLRDIVDKVCPESAPESPAGSGRCTGGAAKECPSGYGVDRPTGRCIKLTTPTCPAGSTYHIMMGRAEINRYPVCIPDLPQLPEQSTACASSVLFSAFNPSTGKVKCLASAGATPSPSSGTTTSTPTSTPAPVTQILQDINQSLKPFRPPTAPGSDKANERNAILSGNRSLVFVQLVLFILLAVLVVYLVLPQTYANGVAFLLLCVGVGYGFFLRR